MNVIRFDAGRAESIAEFASRGASAVLLGEGRGEAHVYCVHFEGPGEIGPHPAGFDQLFLVVQGRGWIAGEDGRRIPLAKWEGARVSKGEVHSKGSDGPMAAVMIQVDRLDLPEQAP